jgi:hypothetical protein
MRGALLRSRLWLAGAILALTLGDGCDLNPQPLPPESDLGNAGGPSGAGGTGSGSGGGFAGGGSSSSGSSGGSGSGADTVASGSDAGSGAPPPPMEPPAGGGTATTADAGATEEDAAMADGGDASVDAAAGVPIDGGSEGSPPDAATDAGSASDAGCVGAWECYVSYPGKCGVCPWPLDYSVCIEGRCACACEERDAALEQ